MISGEIKLRIASSFLLAMTITFIKIVVAI